MMQGFRVRALFVAAATTAACAHLSGAAVVPTTIAELRALIAAARTPVSSYTAEVRLTYFGGKGRMRGTATLAVSRPTSLRYEVMGPHGAAIAAFATNGAELQAADLAASRFVYGPATRENLDELFTIAPMHLGAAEWVSLLFGEVAIPDEAQLAYDDHAGRILASWADGSQKRRVEIDARSHRVARATVAVGAQVLTEVEVRDWDERGLPASLEIRVPATGDDVEMKLRDVAYEPTLDPALFVLEPPRGAKLEHLGAGG